MLILSLQKLAKIVNGRVLSGNKNNKAEVSVSRYRGAPPAAITFITRPVINEQKLLNSMRHHKVQCVVTGGQAALSPGKWLKANIAVIKVPDLTTAYLRLAGYYRKKFTVPIVQVIGSSGKTTTKEMIGAVLAQSFPCLIGRENLNNPRGVAFNLLQLNETHQAAVLEAGMKGAGIMRAASRIIRPDIAVLTSIHSAHLASFGSMQKIISAKAEILEYLDPNGVLIINGVDSNCLKFPLQGFHGKIIRFGFAPHCDIWASDIEREEFSTRFTVHTGGLEFPGLINTIGKYNVGNALAAIAVGLHMGMEPEQITRGLAAFNPVDSRLKIYRTGNGATIIDDNFNANPDSTQMLVEELGTIAANEPVVLVLGDMERPAGNIAAYARRVHFDIGKKVAQAPFHHVIVIGNWGREYMRGALAGGFPREKIEYYSTVRAAEASFAKQDRPGNILVFKASPYTMVNKLMNKVKLAEAPNTI